MALLAAFALLTVSSKCAVLWLGDLLYIGFAHFIVMTVSGCRLLALHISVWCPLCLGQ